MPEHTEISKRQHSDSAQGGEGTNSLHNKSYDPMLKNIGTPPGNTTGGDKVGSTEGTK